MKVSKRKGSSRTVTATDKPKKYAHVTHDSSLLEKIYHVIEEDPALFQYIVFLLVLFVSIPILVISLIGYLASDEESQSMPNNFSSGDNYFNNITIPSGYPPCPIWSLGFNTLSNTIIYPADLTSAAFIDSGCSGIYTFVPQQQSVYPTIGVLTVPSIMVDNISTIFEAAIYGSFSPIPGQGQRISVLQPSGNNTTIASPTITDVDFSIVVWASLYMTNTTQDSVLIGPDTDTTLRSGPAIIVNGITGNVIVTDAGLWRMYGNTAGFSVSNTPLINDTSTMIVSTYNSSTRVWNLYLDGVESTLLPGSLSSSAPMRSYNKGLAIGNWASNNTFESFRGSIGNVALYDYTLSRYQVISLYMMASAQYNLPMNQTSVEYNPVYNLTVP